MKQCFHFSNIKSCINISNSILKFFKFEMIRNLNVYSRYAALTRHINIKRLNITTNGTYFSYNIVIIFQFHQLMFLMLNFLMMMMMLIIKTSIVMIIVVMIKNPLELFQK